MNDAELSEMIKKAQDMIKNNQVPDDIRQMASSITSRNDYQDHSYNNTSYNNSNNAEQSNFQNSQIDMETLLKMQKIMSSFSSNNNSESNSDDDFSQILLSLGPLLKKNKKGKMNDNKLLYLMLFLIFFN